MFDRMPPVHPGEILSEDFPEWEKQIRDGDRLIKERF